MNFQPSDYRKYTVKPSRTISDTPRYNLAKKDNRAIQAMKKMQKLMTGEAERLGLRSEEDVMDMIKELRREDKI